MVLKRLSVVDKVVLHCIALLVAYNDGSSGSDALFEDSSVGEVASMRRRSLDTSLLGAVDLPKRRVGFCERLINAYRWRGV